ncbi:MAG TPA: hypothetical protein VFK39_03400 [Gemmatimonadaceae bacterium]|nr:hypothetical protein [Gemmatimonadaceae bacterium]
MRHLDPERLAAIGDSEPTAEEAAHLAGCAICERERLALRELIALSRSEGVAPLQAPLTNWKSLSARLRDEGIIRPAATTLSLVAGDDASRRTSVRVAGVDGEVRARGRSRASRTWLRAAAAVVLAGGSMAMGRATANVRLPLTASGTEQGGAAHVTGGANSAPGASLAANMTTGADSIMSIEDALSMMRRAESEYRLAAAYIAASDTSAPGSEIGVDRYRARLAALDRVSDAALAAVNEAPADPIVNQYLISTRAARAVTLQQLNSSLPPGMSLTSY